MKSTATKSDVVIFNIGEDVHSDPTAGPADAEEEITKKLDNFRDLHI